MLGNHLDLTSDVPRREKRAADDEHLRKFLGVHFACCDVYGRIYVTHTGDAYAGNCPRCAKRLSVRIGPGGTDMRFFKAY